MERLSAGELRKLIKYAKMEIVPDELADDFGALVDRRISELGERDLVKYSRLSKIGVGKSLLLFEPNLPLKYSRTYLTPKASLIIIGKKGVGSQQILDQLNHELLHIRTKAVVGRTTPSLDYARAVAELKAYDAEKRLASPQEWGRIVKVRRYYFNSYWGSLTSKERDKLLPLAKSILGKPKATPRPSLSQRTPRITPKVGRLR